MNIHQLNRHAANVLVDVRLLGSVRIPIRETNPRRIFGTRDGRKYADPQFGRQKRRIDFDERLDAAMMLWMSVTAHEGIAVGAVAEHLRDRGQNFACLRFIVRVPFLAEIYRRLCDCCDASPEIRLRRRFAASRQQNKHGAGQRKELFHGFWITGRLHMEVSMEDRSNIPRLPSLGERRRSYTVEMRTFGMRTFAVASDSDDSIVRATP